MINNILATCLILLLMFSMSAQQAEIELNSSIPGLSIKNNLSTSSGWLDLKNNSNNLLQLGITGTGNTFFGTNNTAYLATLNNSNTPIIIAPHFKEVLRANTDGQVIITGGSTEDSIVLNVQSNYTGIEDVIGVNSMIYPNGMMGSGIGGEFSGGLKGIKGSSYVGIGVEGFSSTGTSISGFSNFGIGIEGVSTDSVGVVGISSNDNGVVGISNASEVAGVLGFSNITNGIGVRGISIQNVGVSGQSSSGAGLQGSADTGFGLIASSNQNIGILGISVNSHGVVGRSDNSTKFDFRADGDGMDYGTSSSRRWKLNIENISNPLELISRLRGVRYDWDHEHGGRHDIGFIAEEVGAILPEIVSFEENGIDATAMDYTKVSALIVEAFNQFRIQYEEKIEELEERIAELEGSSN